MHVAILYFSGTGNTWWAAHEIAKHLLSKGNTAIVASIESDKFEIKNLLEKSDVVLFGNPVQGSDAPPLYKNYLKQLPNITELSNKEELICGTFVTQLLFSGDGARFQHKFLKENGYTPKWAVHFKMPSNTLLRTKGQAKHGIQKEKRLEKTTRKIDKFVNKLISDKKWIQGKVLGHWMGYLLQRAYFKKEFLKMRKLLRIEKDRCTICGLCVDLCPTKNIIIGEKSVLLKRGEENNCTLCLRCLHVCPQKAFKLRKTPYHKEKSKLYSGPTNEFKFTMLTNDYMEYVEEKKI